LQYQVQRNLALQTRYSLTDSAKRGRIMANSKRAESENLDPITGEHGAHPVGTGLGAATGGAAVGAAAGLAAGPIGVAVGTVVGAVVGGLGGKAIAESIDPTVEDAYWSENHRTRPYYDGSLPYDHYRPAYQQGWEAASLTSDKSWDEIELELKDRWNEQKSFSKLDWENARQASRDAWHRIKARDGSTISENV
jgi:uncharacterized protein YcfJ